MGFDKNKGLSVVSALIVLVLFHVIAFVLPFTHTITFWLGYSFAVFSILLLLAVSVYALNASSLKGTFYRLSTVNLAWIYFVIQIIAAILQMVIATIPYMFALILNSILAALFLLLILAAYAGRNEVERIDNKVSQKVLFIKNLQVDLELLTSTDKALTEQLDNLIETVRYSDPMSHSNLGEIESKITDKFGLLKECLNNPPLASALCGELQQLFAQRNKKCKLLKDVPEPSQGSDNSGVKMVVVAFGITGLLIIGVLITSFVIVPTSRYNAAAVLLDAGNYEEATTAFGALGNYRDSMARVAEANDAQKETKYKLAEKYYKEQQYVAALELYKQLGDYEDSKKKTEQISNMLATGGEVYFGSYAGQPLAWEILDTQSDKMLLISQNPIAFLPYHTGMKNITWQSASIRTWLNNEFLEGFTEEQQSRIMKSVAEDIEDKIFLLSETEYTKYAGALSFKTTSDWWLRTKTDAGMMFVYGETGDLNTTGESVIRALGVRPCVWVRLY